jgi:hypothetical protein
MINFALTQGMKNNDLIQELKGNVTGNQVMDQVGKN